MNLTEVGRLGHWVDLSKLKEDSVIVDVGACKGEFIQEMRNLVNCKIVAIEPDAESFKSLEEQHFENVELRNNALVGNDEKPFSIFYSYPQKELGNLYGAYPGEREVYTVKTIKLGDLKLRRIDYLKMDIEGAEEEWFKQLHSNELADVFQLSIEVHARADKDFIKKKLVDNGFVVKEMDRCEIYAYKPAGWKHEYSSVPTISKISERCMRDYYHVWTLDWYRENVFKYIKPSHSVLDIGCGNGRMMEIFPEYFKRYVGIDLFEYGDNLYDLYSEHFVGDFEDYEFSEKFDCICFFASLYQATDKFKAIEKAVKMLNPGGQIIVVDGTKRESIHLTDTENWAYNLEAICELLKFNCKKVEEKDTLFVKVCEPQS